MNKHSIYGAVLRADSITIRRDATLMLLIWVPLLILGIVRFGLPVLINYVPLVAPFQVPIISFFALLSAVFPGFILSFILLDEKDLGLIPVLKATPSSLQGVLKVRLFSLIGLAFINSLLLMLFNGSFSPNIIQSIIISLLCALNVPFIVLFISVIAKNKVEGLTLLKLINVLLILPIVTLFTNSPWEYLLGLLPPFWVYQIFEFINEPVFYLIAGIGFLVTTIINSVTFRWSINRL